ncbi:hypothetical protein FJK68_03195, partial [Escherichia coli]|nr:hypothetical protein [Escherichia coli]
MDDTSRDPAITEDEIRALQFSAGDVAEIEQTILSFVDACHTRKVAMVVGSTGFAPIFPDTCYHLTHYWPAAADIPVASDNPVHYADAIRYNAR